MTAGSLTPAQQLHAIVVDLEQRTRTAHLPVFADELKEALALLEQLDPESRWEQEYERVQRENPDGGVCWSG